jgi:hypothetical protein
MRKIILFIIVTIVVSSCATINLSQDVPTGKFNIKGDLYYEELELKSDGTFNLKIQEAHTTRKCEGKWKIKSNDELVLNGVDNKKFQGADSLFYKRLNCKDLLLKFESKNKIKRENYYLKRMK